MKIWPDTIDLERLKVFDKVDVQTRSGWKIGIVKAIRSLNDAKQILVHIDGSRSRDNEWIST